MKTIKISLLLLLFVMVLPLNGIAQEKNRAYLVHEDQVKPSMTDEYEAISKEFIEACQKHGIQNADWFTAQINDGTYLSITPIEKMADMDKRPFAPLFEKMGEEAASNIFKRFNKCYDKHGDYVVILNAELTYMPDGIDVRTEGENYRKWHFMHVTPNNIQNLKGKLKELKALFEKKGSKMHYRIYHNGFGNMGDYYLAVISAKNAVDYAEKAAANQKLLGDEGKKLFDEVFSFVDRYEVKEGGMRPDLSYTYNPN